MAQRLVHYLLGEALLKNAPRLCACNAARFRAGNLLPDAYGPGKPSPDLRKKTHFITETERGRISDFERFRLNFAEKIPSDGLYLGYYLHLAQDACFRVFWHGLRLGENVRSLEDVSFLHRDYHILNRHIVTAYGLENRLSPDIGIEAEPISSIFPFDLPLLRADLAADFADEAAGDTRFLSAELIDEFIKKALPVCEDALHRILNGAEPLSPHELTWKSGGVS